MNAEMLFIIGSLVFALTVIIAANIWVLTGPAETELQRALTTAIEDMLDTGTAARRPDRGSRHITENADRDGS
jgi:hypothetical protein